LRRKPRAPEYKTLTVRSAALRRVLNYDALETDCLHRKNAKTTARKVEIIERISSGMALSPAATNELAKSILSSVRSPIITDHVLSETRQLLTAKLREANQRFVLETAASDWDTSGAC